MTNDSVLSVAIANVDDYTGEAHCPRCGHEADHFGTPRIPASALEAEARDQLDDNAASDGGATLVPAAGWYCDRHRRRLGLILPYDLAPDDFAPIGVTVDGENITAAVPKPVLNRGDGS